MFSRFRNSRTRFRTLFRSLRQYGTRQPGAHDRKQPWYKRPKYWLLGATSAAATALGATLLAVAYETFVFENLSVQSRQDSELRNEGKIPKYLVLGKPQEGVPTVVFVVNAIQHVFSVPLCFAALPLAQYTRVIVCSHDFSNHDLRRANSREEAKLISRVLKSAGETNPVVLVAQDLNWLSTLKFAARNSGAVAGVFLVNPFLHQGDEASLQSRLRAGASCSKLSNISNMGTLVQGLGDEVKYLAHGIVAPVPSTEPEVEEIPVPQPPYSFILQHLAKKGGIDVLLDFDGKSFTSSVARRSSVSFENFLSMIEGTVSRIVLSIFLPRLSGDFPGNARLSQRTNTLWEVVDAKYCYALAQSQMLLFEDALYKSQIAKQWDQLKKLISIQLFPEHLPKLIPAGKNGIERFWSSLVLDDSCLSDLNAIAPPQIALLQLGIMQFVPDELLPKVVAEVIENAAAIQAAAAQNLPFLQDPFPFGAYAMQEAATYSSRAWHGSAAAYHHNNVFAATLASCGLESMLKRVKYDDVASSLRVAEQEVIRAATASHQQGKSKIDEGLVAAFVKPLQTGLEQTGQLFDAMLRQQKEEALPHADVATKYHAVLDMRLQSEYHSGLMLKTQQLMKDINGRFPVVSVIGAMSPDEIPHKSYFTGDSVLPRRLQELLGTLIFGKVPLFGEYMRWQYREYAEWLHRIWSEALGENRTVLGGRMNDEIRKTLLQASVKESSQELLHMSEPQPYEVDALVLLWMLVGFLSLKAKEAGRPEAIPTSVMPWASVEDLLKQENWNKTDAATKAELMKLFEVHLQYEDLAHSEAPYKNSQKTE